MTAAQFERLDEPEAARILGWRYDELLRSGYEGDTATVLAATIEVDLHVACDLARRGCPAETALRILL